MFALCHTDTVHGTEVFARALGQPAGCLSSQSTAGACPKVTIRVSPPAWHHQPWHRKGLSKEQHRGAGDNRGSIDCSCTEGLG